MANDRDRQRKVGGWRRSLRVAPRLEGLEDRKLLYATTGGLWTHSERITFSFVPDGTDVGGTPSVLFSTLDAKFATTTWQNQFRRAAALWEQVADINLVEVSDNGAALGSTGNQQGDANFGDIRIAAVPQGAGTLAFAFLPPPFNGASLAGDIVFNSSANWQINTNYDVQTVAAHEFGHSLGLDHSASTTASMYSYYNAIKQALTSDDISGLQSIYGGRAADAYEGALNNNTFAKAVDITSLIDGSNQIVIPSLDIASSSDFDWFKFTVPASTTGTLTATVQSTNLSLLSPRVQIYNSSNVSQTFATATYTYGATVTTSGVSVSSGQVYYVRASAANSGPTSAGGYGMVINLGVSSIPTIAPPNTTVAAQADAGGGSLSETVEFGSLFGAGDTLTILGFDHDHGDDAGDDLDDLDEDGHGDEDNERDGRRRREREIRRLVLANSSRQQLIDAILAGWNDSTSRRGARRV